MDVEAADDKFRQTAPFWAVLGAVLSFFVGPLGFLLSVGSTAYILRNGTYSEARKACAIVSCVVALLVAAAWIFVLSLHGFA